MSSYAKQLYKPPPHYILFSPPNATSKTLYYCTPVVLGSVSHGCSLLFQVKSNAILRGGNPYDLTRFFFAMSRAWRFGTMLYFYVLQFASDGT